MATFDESNLLRVHLQAETMSAMNKVPHGKFFKSTSEYPERSLGKAVHIGNSGKASAAKGRNCVAATANVLGRNQERWHHRRFIELMVS